MQLFIGLTFHPSPLISQKIDSFRKRFDSKYDRSPFLQMTLLSPFKIDFLTTKDFEGVSENLADDLEGCFMGPELPVLVSFRGFDFHTGKRNILFLKPKLSLDIFYARELLMEGIKLSGGKFHKQRNLGRNSSPSGETFLPIGRFDEISEMKEAVEKAQIEFGHAPFDIPLRDVTLFEKMPGRWVPRKILYTFPQPSQDLLDNGENFEPSFT